MINSLLKTLPFVRANLQASLQGVNGYTGAGDIQFAASKNGARFMRVGVRGVAGRTADLYVGEALAATIDLDNGRGRKKINSRKGDDLPVFCEGARVEVRQNGQAILEGVLKAG